MKGVKSGNWQLVVMNQHLKPIAGFDPLIQVTLPNGRHIIFLVEEGKSQI